MLPVEDALRVLMVVYETKSMSDLITDAMMEATYYKYRVPGGLEDKNNNILRGKAQSGMVNLGKDH